MIIQDLLLYLLKYDPRDLQEIAEFVPNEIVYQALIIREFMKERAIEDPRQGRRQFYAFERGRLKELGFIHDLRPLNLMRHSTAPVAATASCW